MPRNKTPSPPPVSPDDHLLSVRACAAELGVCLKTIRRAIWSGRLRAFKCGPLVRIRQADWELYKFRHLRPVAMPQVLDGPPENQPEMDTGTLASIRNGNQRKQRPAKTKRVSKAPDPRPGARLPEGEAEPQDGDQSDNDDA